MIKHQLLFKITAHNTNPQCTIQNLIIEHSEASQGVQSTVSVRLPVVREEQSKISHYTALAVSNIKMIIPANLTDKQLQVEGEQTLPRPTRTDGFAALTDIIKQHKTVETLELTIEKIPNDQEIYEEIAKMIAAILQSQTLQKLTLNLRDAANGLLSQSAIRNINQALHQFGVKPELCLGLNGFYLWDQQTDEVFFKVKEPPAIAESSSKGELPVKTASTSSTAPSTMDKFRYAWASITNTLINNTSRPLMGISAFTFLTGMMIPILNKTWEENPYDGGAAEVFMVAAAMFAVVGGGMALVAKRGDSATLAVGYTLAWIGAVAIAAAAAWTLYAGEAIEYSTDPSQIYQVDNATEKLYTAMYIMTGVGGVATAFGVGKTAYNRGL